MLSLIPFILWVWFAFPLSPKRTCDSLVRPRVVLRDIGDEKLWWSSLPKIDMKTFPERSPTLSTLYTSKETDSSRSPLVACFRRKLTLPTPPFTKDETTWTSTPKETVWTGRTEECFWATPPKILRLAGFLGSLTRIGVPFLGRGPWRREWFVHVAPVASGDVTTKSIPTGGISPIDRGGSFSVSRTLLTLTTEMVTIFNTVHEPCSPVSKVVRIVESSFPTPVYEPTASKKIVTRSRKGSFRTFRTSS